MGVDKQELKNRSWKRPAPPAPSAAAPPSGSSSSGASPSERSCYEYLYALLTDDTGWLRMSPDGLETCYIKWKWTSGPLRGRYVMAVGQQSSVVELLRLVLEKREAAVEGRGPSTVDRYAPQA